jgi:aerobic carbon-monoxide dehydrogenase small subunit
MSDTTKITINLTINGAAAQLVARPGDTLLDALRDNGRVEVKKGCEQGTCGSCVVLVGELPQYACLLFAASREGQSITTSEELDRPGVGEKPHPIVQAFVEEAGVQCGYCVPGMILSTKVLLERNPAPSETQARRALDGHLCRCTGYVKQIKAVLRAAELMQTDDVDTGEV